MYSLLELLIAVKQGIEDKLFLNPDDFLFLCIEAADQLGIMIPELNDEHPEFISWINEVGKKLNSNYNEDDPWNCDMKTKMEILRNKIEELQKEVKCKKFMLL